MFSFSTLRSQPPKTGSQYPYLIGALLWSRLFRCGPLSDESLRGELLRRSEIPPAACKDRNQSRELDQPQNEKARARHSRVAGWLEGVLYIRFRCIIL